MRKNIGAVALTACLLSLGSFAGLRAQEHHGDRGHAEHGENHQGDHDHGHQQASKKQQKQIAHQQAEAVRVAQRANARVRVTPRTYVVGPRTRTVVVAPPARAYVAPRAYVTTGPVYRYRVSGLTRSTSRNGAVLLRTAVSDGYQEGYLAGRRDVSARYGFALQSGPLYRSALLGYSAGSVPTSDYQYYFRQGYDRGYQDGYYQRHQFGTVSSGKALILGGVLGSILGFAIH